MAKKLNDNDKLILNTKKEIDELLKKISETEKGFIKRTNFILDWNGNKYNLNVLPQDQNAFLRWQLTDYKKFLVENNLPLKISYNQEITIDDWLHDLEKVYSKNELASEKNRLKRLQDLLQSKLTEETKTSLELQELVSQVSKS